MSELLQEYVDSRHERLRVDRSEGVIRGVKLLGLNSRNGRRYRETALTDAIGLYEGAKVNINHPKGHPLAPRDYQDRLGVVRGVEFRAGEGLFGDLHFNPKHVLSEQLIWDAEHAPQNVGMSHNVLARTKREGEETVVEAITKVQSIDLVADPATTSGLYEQVEVRAAEQKSGSGVEGPSSGLVVAGEQAAVALKAVTLEQLQHDRPDIISEIKRSVAPELEQLRRRFDELAVKERASKRREQILELLREFELPMPFASHGEADGDGIISEPFLQSLMTARDETVMRSLVKERAALVRSAANWGGNHRRRDRRPRSRDQAAVEAMLDRGRGQTAAQFAAALRGA